MTTEEIVFSKLSSSEDSIPSLKSLVKKYANEKAEEIIIEFEIEKPIKKRKRRRRRRRK